MSPSSPTRPRAKSDLARLSTEELLKMEADLKAFLEERRKTARKEALDKIREIALEHNLSYDEIVAAIRTTTKRGKAPAIYRNPDRPKQTWSGKGEPPAWYTNAKDKEALRIPT